jgi:large repetitive protein
LHRRLALATFFVCLVTPLFSAIYAQSCPPAPPPISLQNAEICAGASDHAWTTSGLAGYVWSATHGSIVTSDGSGNVTFSSDGTGDVALSVTATDFNGCANTNSVTVPLHTITAPAVTVRDGNMCATGQNYASVATPAPSGPGWVSIQWTVAHGTILNDPSTSQIWFTADNSGQPVVVTVDVVDEQGCNAQSVVTVPIRTIAPPAITLWDSTMCSQGYDSATVGPPAPSGPGWTSIAWTIQHGTIPGPSNASTVSFTGDGSGQTVVLSVAVQDENGCTAQNSASVSIRTIDPPAISVYAPDDPLCPNVQGYASIPDRGPGGLFWRQITWTIEHGTINGGGNTSHDVYFVADGSGETIVVHVAVVSDDGCPASASATKLARVMAPPALHVQNSPMCANSSNSATVDGPAGGGSWGSIYWSIENGSLQSSGWNPTTAYFTSDGSGLPVVLHAYVSELYTNCNAVASVTIPISAPPAPPEIHLDQPDICPAGGYGQAWIDNSASGSWSTIFWSVDHGTITSGANSQYVYFVADGSGLAPVVHVDVQDQSGCQTSNSATMTIRSIAAPEIHLYTPDVCPNGGYEEAWVDNPASGWWSNILWSVEHGTITSGANSQYVYFVADGSGLAPVVHVQVQDDRYCLATSSATVAIRSIPAPEVHLYTPDVCPNGGYEEAWIDNPASGWWSNILWSVEHGTITSGANSQYVYFTPDGSGLAPVVHVQAQDDRYCLATNSATVAIRSIAAPEVHLYTPDVCPNGGYDEVWVDNPASGWWSTIVWSIEHGTITSGANSQYVYFTADGSGIAPVVHVQVQDDRYCLASSSATVTIRSIAPPTVTASGPLTFCTGGSVTLIAPDGFNTYQWSNGASTQSITVSTTAAYTVTVTDFSGCSATSDPVSVNAYSAPAPTITADGPTTFCANYSVGFTASAGASYLWSTGATTQSIRAYTTGNYTVTVTDAHGCAATSAPVHVEALPLPVPTVTGIPAAICQGATGHASVAETFASYAWSSVNATIVGPTNGQSVDFVAGTPQSCAIFLTVTGSNGCSWSYSYNMSVNSGPNPDLLADTTDCLNGTHVANVWQPATGSTFAWSITNGTIVSVEDYQGNPTPNGPVVRYNALAAGQLIITVTETNISGCTKTVSRTVNVTQPTPMDFTVPSVCPGATGTAHSVNNYGNYYWTITNGTILSGGNSHDVTFRASSDPANPTTLTLDAPLSGACVSPVTKTVPFTVLPPPPFSLGAQSLCPSGNSYATIANNYNSYAWTIVNGTIISGASSPTVSFTAGTSGSVGLTLTVTSGGCTSSKTVNIPIEDTTPPAITSPDTICYLGTFTASVPAGYDTYAWGYNNSTLVSGGTPGNSIMLRSDGTGRPINLTVTMWRNSGAGCQVVATKTITYAATPTPAIGLNVPANFCTGMTGQASVTNGPFVTYAWTITGGTISGPANGQSISFIPDGSGNTSVAVTVTDGRGNCSANNSQFVTQANFKPSIAASNGLNFCAGSSTTLTASSGADSYLWSTGATTAAITVNSAGNYTVTTTKNGCSFSSTVAVTTYPVSASIAADKTTYCANESAATLTVSWSGFTGFFRTIHWYATDSQFSLGTGNTLTASNYTRTYYAVVSDEKGCSAQSNNIIITVNPLPAATITASGPTTFCAGGSVTLTASSGASYLWSTGATTQAITVSTAGSYTVAVTNGAGCSATSAARNVIVNSLAAPTITFDKPDFCPESNVTASVPAGFVSYAWSVSAGSMSGQGTNSILIQVPGTNPLTVSVTVTDSNGCSATSSATLPVRNFPKPIVSVDVTQVCAGGTAHASVTNGPYSAYFWTVVNGTVVSGAGTSQIAFTPNSGGLMTVHVTAGGADNCSSNSDDVSVAVNTPATPTITAGGATTFCPGGNVTLTSSSANSYTWSTGEHSQSITVTAAGDYTVTTTDANGCSATSSATAVSVDPAMGQPTAAAQGPTSICPGGSVTMTATGNGGNGVYSYQWYNINGAISGATSQTYTASPASNQYYYAVVSDSIGCSSTSSNAVVVTVNPNPDATMTAPATVCAGAASSASVADAGAGVTYAWTVTGGTLDYTMSNGAAAFFHSNAGANSVVLHVTVTTAAGCSATSQSTVAVNPLPNATITPSGPTTFCAGGSVTLTAPAGMSVYSWSDGSNGASLIVTTTGTYHVTVTDANGCSAQSGDVAVTVNSNPTPAITAPNAICSGASGNASTAAVSGATYAWTISGGTITSGSGTNAITFTATSGPVSLGLTVTNSTGCSGTASQNVSVNPLPDATITAPGSFCSGTSATASVPAVSGGSYAWTITGGTITGGSGTNTITFTSTTDPVSLGVTVTTAASCSASSSKNVTVNALPDATITAPGSFCSGTSATASVPAVSGGSYAWTITGGTITGGSGTNTITFTSTTGPVSLGVTVTTAASCSASSSKNVTVNALPNATITAPSGFCSGTSATASVPAVSGGSYAWTITGGTITGGSGTSTITFTSTGTTVALNVTVTNASNCSSSGSANVAVNANPATPAITAGGPTMFCAGGSVTLTAPVSSGYHWSTGESTRSIVVTTTGSYTVWVTNASGCASPTSAPTYVTVNPATAITQQPASITIPHNTTTTLSVTATGAGTLSYQWYNPPTANNNDTSKKVGTNSPTFTTPKLNHGTFYYYVVVTGSCGTVRSSIATVTSN